MPQNFVLTNGKFLSKNNAYVVNNAKTYADVDEMVFVVELFAFVLDCCRIFNE